MNFSRRIKLIEQKAFHEQGMAWEEILEQLEVDNLEKDIKLPDSLIEWLESLDDTV